jgi:hypothetical protein
MKKNLIYSGGKSHGIRKGRKTKKAPPERWLTPGGTKEKTEPSGNGSDVYIIGNVAEELKQKKIVISQYGQPLPIHHEFFKKYGIITNKKAAVVLESFPLWVYRFLISAKLISLKLKNSTSLLPELGTQTVSIS